MLGALLYISTLAHVPHVFAIVIAFGALLKRWNVLQNTISCNKNFVILFGIFLFGCSVNMILHGGNAIPNMYLQPFMLICAFTLNRNDAKWFVIFTFIECFVGFYEYYNGIVSVIPGVNDDVFTDGELLYFKRVTGLSVGSSSYSQKVLYSIVFVACFREMFSPKIRKIVFFVYVLGLFSSFNRTSMAVALFFSCFILYRNYKVVIKKYSVFVCLLLASIIGGIVIEFGDDIIFQFTRGGGDNVLTGRPYIWSIFSSFINQHFFWGNGSVHLLVPYYSGDIHAHNSYLQLCADHGIFLAMLYMLNVMLKLNKYNYVYCIPLFLTSFTQYIIFWGFSIADVFLFAFLCNPYFYRDFKSKRPIFGRLQLDVKKNK